MSESDFQDLSVGDKRTLLGQDRYLGDEPENGHFPPGSEETPFLNEGFRIGDLILNRYEVLAELGEDGIEALVKRHMGIE